MADIPEGHIVKMEEYVRHRRRVASEEEAALNDKALLEDLLAYVDR